MFIVCIKEQITEDFQTSLPLISIIFIDSKNIEGKSPRTYDILQIRLEQKLKIRTRHFSPSASLILSIKNKIQYNDSKIRKTSFEHCYSSNPCIFNNYFLYNRVAFAPVSLFINISLSICSKLINGRPNTFSKV